MSVFKDLTIKSIAMSVWNYTHFEEFDITDVIIIIVSFGWLPFNTEKLG